MTITIHISKFAYLTLTIFVATLCILCILLSLFFVYLTKGALWQDIVFGIACAFVCTCCYIACILGTNYCNTFETYTSIAGK